MDLICTLLGWVIALLVAYVILGWVVELGRLNWGHPIRKVYDVLGRGIRPVLRPIRDALPPLRVGGVALDLSIIVVFFGITIIRAIIC